MLCLFFCVQDNRSLKEQNDELNGQIINLSIQGAKSLFTESLSESLAAEINNVSRTEVCITHTLIQWCVSAWSLISPF